jgi:hypothetical protein
MSTSVDEVRRDNVTESWLCVDCGVNTAPRMPDGPTLRALLLTQRPDGFEMTFDETSEVYMVRNVIWAKVGMRGRRGCLCIGCLETRLGRGLRPSDFVPNHVLNLIPGTARLYDRRGHGADDASVNALAKAGVFRARWRG